MKPALAQPIIVATPPQEGALRGALEEIRLLAAQSKLLALNTAFEATLAPVPEAVPLAGRAAEGGAGAERVLSAVDALLAQIDAANDYLRH